MKLSYRQLFDVFLVVVLLAFVIIAAGYNAQARMMPLIIGIPVLLAAILHLINDLRNPPPEEPAEGGGAPPTMGHTLKIYGWMLLMFVMLYLIGFTLTIFVFPLIYLKIQGGRSWRMAGAISLGALAFVYIVMIYGLNVDLYDGVVVMAFQKAFLGY